MTSDVSGNGVVPDVGGGPSTEQHTAGDGYTITPSDGSENRARALFIGGAGNVAVKFVSGRSVTFVGVTTGSILPVQITHVLSTGTTATNIVGLI